jgi:DNA repair exonuclease SbcCD ATPase subunit
MTKKKDTEKQSTEKEAQKKRLEERLKALSEKANEEREEKKAKKLSKEKLTELEEKKKMRQKAVEEAIQEKAKIQYPDDICPVCNTHIIDNDYLFIAPLSLAICGKCRNAFMPKSKFDQAKEVLEKEESPITVPQAQVPKDLK